MDFKKQAFPSRAFTLKSVYEKQSMQMQEFFKILQYLVATYSIDIIAGECNYHLLKVLENNLLDIFTDHVQMVNKPTHVSGYLIKQSISRKVCWRNVSLKHLLETFTFQIMMLLEL